MDKGFDAKYFQPPGTRDTETFLFCDDDCMLSLVENTAANIAELEEEEHQGNADENVDEDELN